MIILCVCVCVYVHVCAHRGQKTFFWSPSLLPPWVLGQAQVPGLAQQVILLTELPPWSQLSFFKVLVFKLFFQKDTKMTFAENLKLQLI